MSLARGAIRAETAGALAALCESTAQLCDGLSFIHARGLVHRDLSRPTSWSPPAHRAILVDCSAVKRGTRPQHGPGAHGRHLPVHGAGAGRGERVDLAPTCTRWERRCTGCSRRGPPFTEQNQLELLEAVGRPAPRPVSEHQSRRPAPALLACDRLLAKRPEDAPRRLRSAAILRSVASTLLQRTDRDSTKGCTAEDAERAEGFSHSRVDRQSDD